MIFCSKCGKLKAGLLPEASSPSVCRCRPKNEPNCPRHGGIAAWILGWRFCPHCGIPFLP